jgi:pyruvate,water dikinase
MLVSLTEVRRHHAPECGNKAACLGELAALGYAVPRGIVVTTPAYERFLQANALDALAREREAESLTAAPARLVAIQAEVARAFAGAALPPPIAAAIREWTDRSGAAPVAVRSSATNEDLPGASFAGQYDSFLSVEAEGVPIAVVRCFATLFNARAALYRRRKQLTAVGGMAVLIQQMVVSDHAGVVFTRAPGRPDAVLIECAPGGGGAVVSGTVRPNRCYLDRATLSVQEFSGPHPVDWTAVRGAAGQALAIEAAFCRGQDVEYAVAQGAIHILQARPASCQ